MLRAMSRSAAGPVDVLGLVGCSIDQVRFDACVDAGGFGLIYRGFHEGLGEAVAIKCLRISSVQKTNEAIREALAGRFRDETKLLYRLSQGNLDIVRCISSGSVIAPGTKEYTPYMVLEWLDGCTLSVELRERREQRIRPRTLEQAVHLLDSAAGALAYAHAHDVVHRDVKPGNLFLTRTREGVRMKVLDFGLAKILSDESIGVRPSVETGVGVHFCSPSYGAPEQFAAQMGKIGPWTDVYSLTMVLFEVMTGEKVRPAANLAAGLLKAIDPKTGSPSASSLGLSVPAAVEALLLRAVAQNPSERPRDAGVLWSELKAAIAAAPKPNLAMATVMDDSVGDAMQQVRDAQARSMQPAPFTGTMLMQSAPQGAPHLVPAPVPAAGRPPETAGGTQPTDPPMVSRSTAPLAPPVQSVPPPPQGPDSVLQARQRGEMLKGTLPIGAMSPLAASMAVPSPLRHMTPPQQHQPQQPSYGAQQPQQPQQVPPARPPSHPPAGVPAKAGSGVIVFLVSVVVLAIVGATFYWVRMR
ncbi:MAG: serine/threonine protein kinase [Labilithrix sp.]|nr:serine/threonine protein kinase [Labilithrix sp.]